LIGSLPSVLSFQPVHAAKYPPAVFYTPAEHIEVMGDYAEVKVWWWWWRYDDGDSDDI